MYDKLAQQKKSDIESVPSHFMGCQYESRNIVLIGFMGCGKTSIGEGLSKIIKYDFVDTDTLIVQNQSMTISNIFEKYGEDYFRELEKAQVLKVSQMKNTVISTGGGVVLHKINMDNLKKKGIVIYLKSTPEKIYENLKNAHDRPVLDEKNKMDSINELMKIREPLYSEYSDLAVEVSSGGVDFCVEMLEKEVRLFYLNYLNQFNL